MFKFTTVLRDKFRENATSDFADNLLPIDWKVIRNSDQSILNNVV